MTSQGSGPVPSQRVSRAGRVTMQLGLVSMGLFWLVLLLSDDVIFPFLSARVPSSLLIGIATVHVVSAVPAWSVAVARAARLGARRRLLVGAVIVPIAAMLTFGVMLSDALVWRGDLGSWLGPALFAATGPSVLAAFLVQALRAERAP